MTYSDPKLDFKFKKKQLIRTLVIEYINLFFNIFKATFSDFKLNKKWK